jgi:hypothetical protein
MSDHEKLLQIAMTLWYLLASLPSGTAYVTVLAQYSDQSFLQDALISFRGKTCIWSEGMLSTTGQSVFLSLFSAHS